MKRALFPLACALLFALSLCCSACGESEASAFSFLSVRMKGNGDGTVTAVAQNEFTLFSPPSEVVLTVYRADEYQTDVAKMEKIEQKSNGDLPFSEKLTILIDVEKESYFCARLTYTVNGTTQYLQSDTVRYNADGTRI